jgi:hypothetical protein
MTVSAAAVTPSRPASPADLPLSGGGAYRRAVLSDKARETPPALLPLKGGGWEGVQGRGSTVVRP